MSIIFKHRSDEAIFGEFIKLYYILYNSPQNVRIIIKNVTELMMRRITASEEKRFLEKNEIYAKNIDTADFS